MIHKKQWGGADCTAFVVLFHGFMGDHRDWFTTVQHWQEKVPGLGFVAIDLPGHGSTPVSWTSYLDFLKDLEQEVAAIPGAKFGVGYSMGGRVLASLCQLNQNLFDGIFLESASFGIKSDTDRKERFVFDQRLLEPVIQGEIEFAEFIDRWYDMALFTGFKDLPHYPEILQRRLQQDPKTLKQSQNLLSVGVMPPLWQEIEKWQRPVYYCTGRLDKKYSAIARALPKNFHYTLVQESSHNVHAIFPTQFAELAESARNDSWVVASI